MMTLLKDKSEHLATGRVGLSATLRMIFKSIRVKFYPTGKRLLSSFEMFIFIYQNTRRHTPYDSKLRSHHS